jgi:uroporphyrinogen-III synthase
MAQPSIATPTRSSAFYYSFRVTAPSFNGLRVLSLESRRAREIGLIITSYGGAPFVAPSMREVPIESNVEALAFIDDLIAGEFDVVILRTGVGTRVLLDIVQRVHGTRRKFVEALAETMVIARGPKPAAVLRELEVTPWFTAGEPNTWRELLAELDARPDVSLDGLNVAVQEYGVANPDLLAGLEARGARVTRVPVYQWELPTDLEPLRNAIGGITRGEFDVVLFTTATQMVHLMKVAEMMSVTDAVFAGLRRMVIASIGPTTSAELRQQGLSIDLEPTHPKMGFLVREAAEQAQELLLRKKG